jgi:hypothetical protein
LVLGRIDKALRLADRALADAESAAHPRGYHLIVNRGARLSSRAAVASLRVGLPPDARCGIHDDVVDTLGLGEHGHMA